MQNESVTIAAVSPRRKTAQELAEERQSRESKAEAMVDGSAAVTAIPAERMTGDYRVNLLSPPLAGFEGEPLEFREPAYPVNSQVQQEIGNLPVALWTMALPQFWQEDTLDLEGVARIINKNQPKDDEAETAESLRIYLENLWLTDWHSEWLPNVLNALALVCVKVPGMTDEELKDLLSAQLPLSRMLPTVRGLFALMGGHQGGMASRFFRRPNKTGETV